MSGGAVSKEAGELMKDKDKAIKKRLKNKMLNILASDVSPKKFSSKYLEQWINDTLTECEHLNIPGTLSKPEHKMPLSRYGLDRMTLTVTYTSIPN